MTCGKKSGKNVNKKVLLRGRMRHTGCRIASACYAALSNWGGGGGTPSSHDGGGGGYPIQSWWQEGVLHPVMVGGYPIQS